MISHGIGQAIGPCVLDKSRVKVIAL